MIETEFTSPLLNVVRHGIYQWRYIYHLFPVGKGVMKGGERRDRDCRLDVGSLYAAKYSSTAEPGSNLLTFGFIHIMSMGWLGVSWAACSAKFPN
jgi:hypothetical protein